MVEVNKSLNNLKLSIESMRSVSLKSLVDPLKYKKAVDHAVVAELRDVIFENITWDHNGNMELKKRNWADIDAVI